MEDMVLFLVIYDYILGLLIVKTKMKKNKLTQLLALQQSFHCPNKQSGRTQIHILETFSPS